MSLPLLTQEQIVTALEAESTDNPYVIAFEDVWSAYGYSRKGDAKRFILDRSSLELHIPVNRNNTVRQMAHDTRKVSYYLDDDDHLFLTLTAFKFSLARANTVAGANYLLHLIEIEGYYYDDLKRRLDANVREERSVLSQLDLTRTENLNLIWQIQQIQEKTTTQETELDVVIGLLNELQQKLHHLKLQRDNYYDRLQTYEANERWEEEETTGVSTFPRNFEDVYDQLRYKTRGYLFCDVMLDLLRAQEHVDYEFQGPKTNSRGNTIYKNIWISEQLYELMLINGRPKAGIQPDASTPRVVHASRSHLVNHPTRKSKSPNTFQPKFPGRNGGSPE